MFYKNCLKKIAIIIKNKIFKLFVLKINLIALKKIYLKIIFK